MSGARLARACSAAAMVAAALYSSVLPAQSLEHNRITLTGTHRAWTVGDTTISENVAQVRYELFAPRVRFRLDGSALQFSAPAAAISGNLPISAQLDFAPRPADTLTVFARSPSQPFDLTARETSALSTGGTSTIDLQSTALGTVATGGGRVAVAFPLGDQVLSLRAGYEYEPRPGGSSPVYWRGSTMRGGASLTANIGGGSIAAAFDISHSSADSLGGRNLFPGGGNFALQLTGNGAMTNPFDPLEDEEWPLQGVLFYSRPYGNDRSDQPNLIIPLGDLVGALGSLMLPVGNVSVTPTLQYLRETSSSGSVAGAVRSDLSGSSWTLQSGVDVSIPVGDRFELTPTVGYAFGSVGATVSQAATVRRGRVTRTSSFADGIRGTWLALQFSASF